MSIFGCIVISMRNRDGVIIPRLILPQSAIFHILLVFDDFFEIACSYQLIEVVNVKFAIRVISWLSKPRVDYGITLSILEVLLVFEIEQVAQRCFCKWNVLLDDNLLFSIVLTCRFALLNLLRSLCGTADSRVFSFWSQPSGRRGTSYPRTVSRLSLTRLQVSLGCCYDYLWTLWRFFSFEVILDLILQHAHIESSS